MIVTGLDLSLTSPGLVSVEGGQLLSFLNPKTSGKRTDTLQDRQRRLFALANTIVEFTTGSDLVVLESMFATMSAGTHDRSGLWWLVASALMADDIPVVMVSPQGRAKYGTGKGNAKKTVVLSFVREFYTDWFGKRIPNDDIADAILLASMGARWAGEPVETWDLPEGAINAMDGALWPS